METAGFLSTLLLALLFDAVIGDPRAVYSRVPHPTMIFGWAIGFSDKVFKPISRIRKIRVPNNTTLSHLALRYKTSISKLMRWNGLKKATDLRAGMKLIVSKPSNLRDSDHKVIRVRSGDTLSKIAMRYRTSVKTLVALNDLKSKNLLRLNQRLLVPTLTTNES